ncbi:MAG: ANTAR domain-containing protein [Lachnospiraceae bacterium]|nr:ANTAR domain-containing protein [Lachnospiraceae bacterium]
MTGVIVVLPKIEDARNMKNLLVRNGISVLGVCATGAQAIALADGLSDGIVLCGYKLADMLYSQLREDLPPGFEMLLMASGQVIGSGIAASDIMCLVMPIKVHDLINTVDMMIQGIERRKRKRREAPRERSQGDRQLIEEAKIVLMNRNHMSEEEAHRYIQKCSMDSGTNMVETAQMVLTMMRS